ncbi:NADH-quinone oxidoreductase subunit A [Pontibacter flavimaris]|uniref:NADH-quinone oxidoreductase subunit n=1 Tax=Pontibacter flavimaris TaxID=1797110 RepID=A0A1Q5PIT6_9BACT|nr:NADH-quinone oxidoreductase subunit A [Pontibacter flavimaris]OKL42129.1 NADH-quinone oxidoreductase subunit A [Pontibacter flavimaris]
MEPSVNQYLPSDYLPIFIQFAAALGFVIFALVLTHILGPKRTSEVKGAAFESGIESVGDARTPISYKYFITAILFVLFDVEIIFMYPWAVNFREYGLDFFLPMLVFLGVLLAGFFYEIKKGILK